MDSPTQLERITVALWKWIEEQHKDANYWEIASMIAQALPLVLYKSHTEYCCGIEWNK